MSDMLVKLYDLPDHSGLIEKLKGGGVEIRRMLPPEKHVVIDWISKTFSPMWASESEKALANTPVSCFVAVENEKTIGFSCYDATCRGFAGPIGVAESARGRAIGKALLWACLHAMWEVGYAYAVIGGAGPKDFYAQVAGATEIPDSSPGFYRGMLRD